MKNTEIKCLFNSPTGGMRAYLIRGACVALRDEDAATVLVDAADEVDEVSGASGASGGIGNGID